MLPAQRGYKWQIPSRPAMTAAQSKLLAAASIADILGLNYHV
jgi:hypothetical protein